MMSKYMKQSKDFPILMIRIFQVDRINSSYLMNSGVKSSKSFKLTLVDFKRIFMAIIFSTSSLDFRRKIDTPMEIYAAGLQGNPREEPWSNQPQSNPFWSLLTPPDGNETAVISSNFWKKGTGLPVSIANPFLFRLGIDSSWPTGRVKGEILILSVYGATTEIASSWEN